VRLGSPSAATVFHVGGGVGLVDLGGQTYSIDAYGTGTNRAFFSGTVATGAAFKLGPSLALRLDAEEYVFRAHFQCRYTRNTRGVCWAVNQGGTPSAASLQNDLVVSLGLAARVNYD